jgi:hypothetical protein
MNENSPCGDCETVKQEYEKNLDDQKRKLISFRGHGKKIPGGNYQMIEEIPYSNDEIKTLIKLILLGGKKFHYFQKDEKIDASFGGVRICSTLPCGIKRFICFIIPLLYKK